MMLPKTIKVAPRSRSPAKRTATLIVLMLPTFRRGDEGSDEEEEHKDAHNDAQPLDQVHVGDLHGLGRPNPEYHRNPDTKKKMY